MAVETYPDKPVWIWVLDEHRYGLLPVIRRVWGRKGVRGHAPYKTTYQWGYMHEALEVDGEHKVELLFTPMINQDVHAVFLKQIAQSDPCALHVVVMDQARVPHAAGGRARPCQHPCAAAAAILPRAQSGRAVWPGGKGANGEPHLPKPQKH